MTTTSAAPGGNTWGATASDHDLCEAARKFEPCAYCGARPGEACHDHAPGVHLCRICRAATDMDAPVTMLQAAALIHDRDVYTGADLVLDPEGAAA